MLWVILIIFMMLVSMMGVAFSTLLERKVLGLSQLRFGPNKTVILGMFQPLLDGVKLIFKQFYIVSENQFFLLLAPSIFIISFFLMYLVTIPWNGNVFSMKFLALVFFSFLSLNTFAIIFSGWSTISMFSKLGSTRGMLQSLSYEVSLILIFFYILSIFMSFYLTKKNESVSELLTSWLLIWLLFLLMESNRAPFDLLEGESELISGFNVEMSSINFIFLFISEYGMIMVFTILSSVIFFNFFSFMSFSVLMMLLLFIRSCFPRIRYDFMMNLMWQELLPYSFLSFFLVMLLKP